MSEVTRMIERSLVALVIKDTMKQHAAKENMGGGWDCRTCNIRWDWTDHQRASEHAALLAADAVLERIRESVGPDHG